MAKWEHKTLVYSVEGRFTHSLRFWADPSGRAYGPRERSGWVGSLAQEMRLLEAALKELDQEGWELISVSASLAFFNPVGSAVLRKPVGPTQPS